MGDDGEAGEGAGVEVGFVGGRGFAFGVAAHGDDGAAAVFEERGDGVDDHRSFAGAADGEVADADDGDREACDSSASVEATVDVVDGESVKRG